MYTTQDPSVDKKFMLSKVRDMGREICASYESYRRQRFTVQEKHHGANEARRTQDHRVAFLTSCDWVFAAAATFSEPMVVGYASSMRQRDKFRMFRILQN